MSLGIDLRILRTLEPLDKSRDKKKVLNKTRKVVQFDPSLAVMHNLLGLLHDAHI